MLDEQAERELIEEIVEEFTNQKSRLIVRLF